MHIDEAFPSKYLKASDLQGRNVTVKMGRAEVEKIGEDKKLILYFQGKEKGMVLNKTNANNIAGIYGGDTDDWYGKEITLFEAMVDFQGKTVPALRVRAPRRDAPPRQAPQRQMVDADGYDDAPPPRNDYADAHGRAPRRQDTISSGPQSRPEMDDEIPF